MKVKITEQLAKELGTDFMRKFGIEKEKFGWQKYVELDLGEMSLLKIKKLREAVVPHAKTIRGTGILVSDIDVWIKTLGTDASPKARTVEQFTSVITEIIRRVPGHRLFKRNDAHGLAWLCYYVNEIEYRPEHRERDYHSPATCVIDLVWEEFGGQRHVYLSFGPSDCIGLASEEALSRKGYYLETPQHRERHLEEVKLFGEYVGKVGRQFLARGVATDDLDGNNKRREGWWSSRTNRILLDKEGEPSRVVVDVFQEDDKEECEDRVHVDLWFWKGESARYVDLYEDGESVEDDSRQDIPREDLEEQPVVEIPIHPFLACFDLKRHLRLRVHVNYLEEYEYDSDLKDRLVLPADVRGLVEMLLAHKGVFRDIVKGKGGGAVVLCAGPPGTGKTLTAEVYAESVGRPLYSVQASQLGTDPDALEDELLKVFARAQRWNAILLLDEADVYVHTRGNDLAQNAIVGVFLRVLEYYNGILFMTTNRADLVDDAIASRCMARIDYEIPSPEDQRRIWNILAAVAGAEIPPHVIDEIVVRNPRLSGRDVKNLLKLAKLVSDSRGKPISLETVDFVKKFKPTLDVGEAR